MLLVCPGPIDRPDAGERYRDQTKNLPEASHQPGGGVGLKLLSADEVARRLVKALEARQPELVMPGKARLLFAISQLVPQWGDALIRRRFDRSRGDSSTG